MTYIEELSMMATVRLFSHDQESNKYKVCAQYYIEDDCFCIDQENETAEGAAKILIDRVNEANGVLR